jgi:hypothetical protein
MFLELLGLIWLRTRSYVSEAVVIGVTLSHYECILHSQDLSYDVTHGLINYKAIKTKCRFYWCLIEIINWRYSSVILVFSIQLCEQLPLWPSLLFTSPLPKSKYGTLDTDNVWVVLETIFCRSLTLCIWPDSEPTKWTYHPKQIPRRKGGLRQTNTWRKVPLQVFF